MIQVVFLVPAYFTEIGRTVSRLGTLFVFAGSELSYPELAYYTEIGKTISKDWEHGFIYRIRVVYLDLEIVETITRDQESRSHLLDPGYLPGSGILNRNWETNFTNQEHCSHLLDLGCIPGSGTLYRNGKVIFRDQELSSHLLDPCCLPGSDILYRIWEVTSRYQ